VSIPVTTISRAGVAPPAQTDADHTAGMQIDTNDGKTIVEIVSSDAGDQTVDFQLPGTLVDGQAVIPKTVSVPAGETRYAGPFPKGFYNQPGGQLYIDPSVSTTLKFRAYTT
jgi:hypothetical protein